MTTRLWKNAVVPRALLPFPDTLLNKRMLRTSLSLAAVALAGFLLASCGNSSGIAVLSKEKTNGTAFTKVAANGKTSVVLPSPSASLQALAKSKPRDKHNMPVYAFNERSRVVRTTAYTCSESDHLIYGSKNATGTDLRYTNNVRSAAADWSFYPVGTTFRIKGLPYLYVVDDYGSALTGTGTIDIYKPSKEVMNQWGRRVVEVNIVQWGSFDRSARLLAQRSKYVHCKQMLANIVRQRPDLGKVAMN